MNGTALVTGSAGGIGREICLRLAAAGWNVAATDLDVQPLQNLAVTGDGGRILPLPMDVTAAASVRLALDAAEAGLGLPTIVVAAAGVATRSGFLDLPEADFDFVMRVNLKGTFLVFQEAARRLVAQGSEGSLIAISSLCGRRADPFSAHVHYDASKGGVDQLVRSIAQELGPLGIRANAVAPGRIDTPLLRKDPEHRRRVSSRIPLGQYGQPGDVADMVTFLAGPGARYITGAILPVDGGWTAS